MLSAVLRSPTAIKVSIKIMEAFVALRHAFLSSAGILQRLGNVEVKQIETDKRLDTVFDALDRGKPTRSEIEKFNRQYKGLTVEHSDDFHDRYILIDNAELHNLGSSINYLGCRVTNYSTSDPKEIKKLHALLGD